MVYRDEERDSSKFSPDKFHNQRHRPDAPLIECVQQVPVGLLQCYPGHARRHSIRKIKKLGRNIGHFGIVVPLVAEPDGTIIDGHALLAAAQHIGLAHVPVIYVDHLSQSEAMALRLALNRLTEEVEWDKEKLATELQHLVEIDFDVELTGFEMPEVDLAIESLEPAGTVDEADQLPEINDTTPAVSRLGDLWLLGPHKILCGDATNCKNYESLLTGRLAQLVFTDPPYNVPVDGHVCGLGTVKHAEFEMARGEMSEQEFTEFLAVVLTHLTANSIDGSIHYVCMDWRHMGELLNAAKEIYTEFKNLCVWNKTNGGMGSLYRSKHELIGVFKNGSAPHINNVELGRHGRYRTNVWDYPGINTFSDNRRDQLAMHPTVKPVALVADAIKDCSKRGGTVLDPFLGSGTTIIACERTGRVGAGLEIDPCYVDVTISRWETLAGAKARHADTGLTFDELRDQRHHKILLLPPPTTPDGN